MHDTIAGITAGRCGGALGAGRMAMTLRLSGAQTEALRAQARAERASMQEVAKRAIDEYLDAHARATPLDLVLDVELQRYAAALEALSRWTD